MTDKMKAQLRLARIIRAVDAQDTAQRIISKHFLPDLIGNLKQFSGQKVRCTKCGAGYRRVPLIGKCYCGNNLTLTVYEASVKKYLAVTKLVGREYNVSMYIQQRIGLIEDSIRSIFGTADTSTDIDLDSFDVELAVDEEIILVQKPSTLDSFATFGEEVVPEEVQFGPDEDQEEIIAKQSVEDEKSLQAPKKKACNLDDYF
jgi:DNA polymerase II large subunit